MNLLGIRYLLAEGDIFDERSMIHLGLTKVKLFFIRRIFFIFPRILENDDISFDAIFKQIPNT